VSRHHIAQKWSTFTRKRRAELEPQLPLPCVAQRCIRGGVVFPDPPTPVGMQRRPTSWHVGHIVGAMGGGRPTRENTGPIHAACNLHEGGLDGARVTNASRSAGDGIRPW
jgi:hypothetical protein